MLMRVLEGYWVACYRMTLVAVAGVVGVGAFMVHWLLGLLAAYLLSVLLLATWKHQP